MPKGEGGSPTGPRLESCCKSRGRFEKWLSTRDFFGAETGFKPATLTLARCRFSSVHVLAGHPELPFGPPGFQPSHSMRPCQ